MFIPITALAAFALAALKSPMILFDTVFDVPPDNRTPPTVGLDEFDAKS